MFAVETSAMRRILSLAIATVLTVGAVASCGSRAPQQHAAPATSTSTTSTTTSTTLPPATTTTTAAPRIEAAATGAAVPAGRPIDVPRNSYAREPLRTIGRIEIPKLGLRTEMHQGVTLNNIDRGPSHWPGTAMPGHPGNVVVMGHRVTHSRPFRNIHTLVPGDEVFFEVGGIRSRYVMTGHEIVTPDRVDIVRQTAEPTATLFACHPPGSARYRYVVRLRLA